MGNPLKQLFLTMLEPRTQNPGKSSPYVLVPYRNRSSAIELVGREPLMFAKVEDGVTKFWPKKQKKDKILDQKQQFSMGNFHFLAAEKLTFFGRGGGGITSKLTSQ